MTTFSERMTAARKDKKLTQDQVAQALDVSRQLVSHWENGRVEPTQEQREAICKLLDIPMDAPKPTPLHKRILAAAALIAFVAILVMAVYPIYKSRRAGTTAEAAVQETQAALPARPGIPQPAHLPAAGCAAAGGAGLCGADHGGKAADAHRERR